MSDFNLSFKSIHQSLLASILLLITPFLLTSCNGGHTTSLTTTNSSASYSTVQQGDNPNGQYLPIMKDIVKDLSFSINSFDNLPTKSVPETLLLGNGDLGVTQGGTSNHLKYYIGKNDFWTQGNKPSPKTVGIIHVVSESIENINYTSKLNMKLAQIETSIETNENNLSINSLVLANKNEIVINMKNNGNNSLFIKTYNILGTQSEQSVPTSIGSPIYATALGCEQYNDAPRWFFNGSMYLTQLGATSIDDDGIKALARNVPLQNSDINVFNGSSCKKYEHSPVITNELSFSTWIKPSSISPTADYLISSGSWSDSYSIGLSNGFLRFAIGNVYIQSNDRIPLDQWTHIAATYDGYAMKIYINGHLDSLLGNSSAFFYKIEPGAGSRKLEAFTSVVGAEAIDVHGGITFTISPSQEVSIVTAVNTDLDAKDQVDLYEFNKKIVDNLTNESINGDILAHRKWWSDFWNQSFISLPNQYQDVLRQWYFSLYVLASASRAGKVAPGLYGPWVTTDQPNWLGDYHLNYNFEAIYFSGFSENHLSQTIPFYKALFDAIPAGINNARKNNWQGIEFGVGLGPWGMVTASSDWGQRSNASYAAMPFIWYWESSHDLNWLKEMGYPYLKEVALFWEHYLVFDPETNRYVVYNDSIHENSGSDMNPLLSLGLIRSLFKNVIYMSSILKVDQDHLEKWKDILDKISAFPIQTKNGKTVFRYSERGTDWWPDNTLGIQVIFPAEAIGLSDSQALLTISKNTIDVLSRWFDNNGTNTFYSAAVMAGYDPNVILGKLSELYKNHTYENKMLNLSGNGIESIGTSHAITEMLMQSQQGVIRLFPVWPKNLDASFGSLRAAGAFLVWADFTAGNVDNVYIKSEKGNPLIISNPWPEHAVLLQRNGVQEQPVSGSTLSILTAASDVIRLSPIPSASIP